MDFSTFMIKLKVGVIVKCLIYADDVVLSAESKYAPQMMINRLILAEHCEENSLVINEEKTTTFIFGQIGRPPKENWYLRRKRIEKVKEITFLGVLFQTSGWPTAKTILLYGAEVFGVEEQREIETAERYFYKMLYDLPRLTPNHFLTTELGNMRISAKVRSRMCEYRRRVDNMEEQRNPRIVQATMREMGMEMEYEDLCKVVETRNR